MKEIEYDAPQEADVPKKPDHPGGGKVAPLRTYRGDVDEMMKHRDLTKTDIIVAEQKHREAAIPSGEDHSMLFRAIAIAGALFLVLFGIAAYTFFGVGQRESSETIDLSATSTRPNAVTVGDTETIDISGGSKAQLAADLIIAMGKPAEHQGLLREIHFVGKSSDTQISELLAFVAPRAPSAITDKDHPYHFGLYSNTSGYLVLSVGSFPTALASMLRWEQSLVEDLLPILEPRTPKEVLRQYANLPFGDAYISQTDVRTARSKAGDIVFLYGFPTRNTVVIASNPLAFSAVLDGLRSGGIK